MTLEKAGTVVSVYDGTRLSLLFEGYKREFRDEDLWEDAEDRCIFEYLTQVLERSLPSLDFLPIEASHGL